MIRPLLTALFLAFSPIVAFADGKVSPPRDYKGSLEESAQEAIIFFVDGHRQKKQKSLQDLILKIRVVGEVEKFAWVIPLPNAPIEKPAVEDARIFEELHQYVQHRRVQVSRRKGKGEGAKSAENNVGGVKLISRDVVGSYDISIVKEEEEDSLNGWLTRNGYQPIQDRANTFALYRKLGYVFACIRVSDAARKDKSSIDLRPIRFRFEPGGYDGAFFPMRLTGLQDEPFDVNLYVFYRHWINDSVNHFGFTHLGFQLVYRDWDTDECEPNGGKNWANPTADPFLKRFAHLIPTVAKTVAKLHPGKKFYLTNLAKRDADPAEIRKWPADLWMFPHYVSRGKVPDDVRPGGPAAAAYPNSARAKFTEMVGNPEMIIILGVIIMLTMAAIIVGAIWWKKRHPATDDDPRRIPFAE